jgi:serine/threonine-protein kinase RsbW
MTGGRLTLRLPATMQAPSGARRALAELLGRGVDPDTVRESELLVTELVTNAIRHGRLAPDDMVVLEIGVRGSTLRVEVADGGPGFDPATALHRDPESTGGWGLLLVSRMAKRWGVIRGTPNVAWFEIDGVFGPG